MLDNLSPLKTPGCGTGGKYGTHETYVQPEERVRKLAAFHLSLFSFALQCAPVGFCGGFEILDTHRHGHRSHAWHHQTDTAVEMESKDDC